MTWATVTATLLLPPLDQPFLATAATAEVVASLGDDVEVRHVRNTGERAGHGAALQLVGGEVAEPAVDAHADDGKEDGGDQREDDQCLPVLLAAAGNALVHGPHSHHVKCGLSCTTVYTVGCALSGMIGAGER